MSSGCNIHRSFDPRLALSVQISWENMSQDHALNIQYRFQCTNDLILQCISAVALCWICFWPLHSIPISLNVVWYLVYNECTAHGTTLVKGEQIIFHLVLQVYCSPSLKQYLHSPVMALLACNIERTVSILCAHSGGCACVCVLHVHGCVVVCTCALVCVNAFRVADTNLQVYLHVSVITQVQFWQVLVTFLVTYL